MIDPGGGRISYRVAELADLTGLHPRHVLRLVHDGTIPRLAGTGKCVVVPSWAVESWLATDGNWSDPAFHPTTKKASAAVTAEA